VASRIFAFRPASVVHRLAPRSGACPLSARELLGATADLGIVVPLVQAPIAAVARGALVAAKEVQSALGLALPPGVPAAVWFDRVTRAADEVASGLPIVLSADVVVEGEGATQLDRATAMAWELVDAGMTHLALDAAAVAPAERGRVLGEVARPAGERGLSVEVVIPLEGPDSAARARSAIEQVERSGVEVDAASVRCPAPADADDARMQAAALARIAQALGGVPLVRRGPVTAGLLALLHGSPVKACDDGGAAAARAVALVPVDLVEVGAADGVKGRATRLERAAAEMSDDGADRVEASAYVDAMEFLERLGVRGSAPAVVRALERRLEER
jgi:hypothetical protein